MSFMTVNPSKVGVAYVPVGPCEGRVACVCTGLSEGVLNLIVLNLIMLIIHVALSRSIPVSHPVFLGLAPDPIQCFICCFTLTFGKNVLFVADCSLVSTS